MLTEERTKELMRQVGMPNSLSLLQALIQCDMEATMAERERCAKLVTDATTWCGGHGEPPCPGGSELARMIRAG